MKPSTNNDDNENQDARDARHEESSASDIKEKGGYIAQLEARLSSVSNQLEEKHMEAAIDAELECIKEISDNDGGASARKEPSNPNSVSNCLSPFVPTSSERIQAFVDWAGLTSDDVLLDIGCGDGRVCIAAAKLCGCRTIGIDVSPLCINQANSIVREEGMVSLCSFYKTDATVDPELLLSGNDQDIVRNEKRLLSDDLKQVTVVFLYTYPTLLVKLIPLLSHLLEHNNNNSSNNHHQARAVVTLTYHIPHQHVVELKDTNSEFDFQWYTKLKAR